MSPDAFTGSKMRQNVTTESTVKIQNCDTFLQTIKIQHVDVISLKKSVKGRCVCLCVFLCVCV